MIEEKLSHLTPEQRREVEDYIDFLIRRDSGSGPVPPPDNAGSFTEIRDLSPHYTPSIFGEENSAAHHQGQDILPDYPEYGDVGGSGLVTSGSSQKHLSESGRSMHKRVERDPGQLLDWVD